MLRVIFHCSGTKQIDPTGWKRGVRQLGLTARKLHLSSLFIRHVPPSCSECSMLWSMPFALYGYRHKYSMLLFFSVGWFAVHSPTWCCIFGLLGKEWTRMFCCWEMTARSCRYVHEYWSCLLPDVYPYRFSGNNVNRFSAVCVCRFVQQVLQSFRSSVSVGNFLYV